MTDEVATCPECGAPMRDGLTCWDRLGQIGVWEYADPELYALHFFTVAAHNLQHPAQFTEGMLDALRTVFCDGWDQQLPAHEIRRRMTAFTQRKPKPRVLKPIAERRVVSRSWSMTIADVYLPDQPEGAIARVKAWVDAIRRELGSPVQGRPHPQCAHEDTVNRRSRRECST